MIIVRMRETFRERVTEWTLAVSILLWGALVLANPGLFSQPFFQPLAAVMSQEFWGLTATIVGVLRVVFLFINGGWRPSAHIRAIGAAFGVAIWASLFFAAAGLEQRIASAALFGGFVFLDFMSFWWAVGDAKVADMAARKQRLQDGSSSTARLG